MNANQLALLALLKGEIPESDWSGLLDAAEIEGILPLLFSRLNNTLKADDSHSAALAKLKSNAMLWEATALIRCHALSAVLDAAGQQGIDLLVMKGGALAYTLYDSPGQRPCMDTDLLVAPQQVDSLALALKELGYEIPEDTSARLLISQFNATRRMSNGQDHVLDIHYQINNRASFAGLFAFDELLKRSIIIDELGKDARALSHADALLLACLHRIGHLNEGEPEHLIWLYDIHLLIEQMDAETESATIYLMQAKNLVAVCNDGIELSRQCFNTKIPAALVTALDTKPRSSGNASLLNAGPLQTIWLQLRDQPDFRHRYRLLIELFIPPAANIRQKYPDSSAWLPLLYIRRAMNGLTMRMKIKRE